MFLEFCMHQKVWKDGYYISRHLLRRSTLQSVDIPCSGCSERKPWPGRFLPLPHGCRVKSTAQPSLKGMSSAESS